MCCCNLNCMSVGVFVSLMKVHKRANKVTRKQKKVLVDFMFDNIAFARSKLLDPEGKIISASLWQVLCQQLNSEGPRKNIAKWKRVWTDLKINTRKKAATLAGERRKTDRGSPEEIGITELEKKVLQIISKNADFGVVSSEEIPLDSAVTVPIKLENLPQTAKKPEPVVSTSWINRVERIKNEINNTEFVNGLNPTRSESISIVSDEIPSTVLRSIPQKIYKEKSVAVETAADFKELAQGTRNVVENVKNEFSNLNKKIDTLINQNGKLIEQNEKMLVQRNKTINVLERIAVAIEEQSVL